MAPPRSRQSFYGACTSKPLLKASLDSPTPRPLHLVLRVVYSVFTTNTEFGESVVLLSCARLCCEPHAHTEMWAVSCGSVRRCINSLSGRLLKY